VAAESLAIEVSNLAKSYRKGSAQIAVLTGASLRVARGEFVAIMGASGSGKSTLLNILGLLDRADGGKYLLHGEDYALANDDLRSAARNRTIGFIFQQSHLLDRVTAVRNVMLPLLYADHDANDDEARAAKALEAVGLSHRADHVPGELSGGEQQRVAIARALITDPSLLLADEPTGSLDADAAEEILRTFRDLGQAARSIVLVTHDLEVARHADRVLVLEDGRIRAGDVASRAGRA
jgi:putative ABC transport system ATP-binding protein